MGELVDLYRCMIVLLTCTGMGKSRVIAAAIVLKTLYDGSVNFNIVFTTLLLKGVDEQVYKKLEKLLSLSINMVVYDPSSTLES